MGQPHKHAEIIKAWADGSEIEYRNPNMMLTSLPPKPDPWKVVQPDHAWNQSWEYRIKPEPPKYPQTRMSPAEVIATYGTAGFNDPIEPRSLVADALVRVANTAIDRAIEDGDVVPAAMLEKVASAVYEATQKGWSTGVNPDIPAIIAKVKEGKL